MKERKVTSISTKITRLVALSMAFMAAVSSIGGAVLIGSKMFRSKEDFFRLATYTIVQETALMTAENTKMEEVSAMLADFKSENATDVTIFNENERAFSTLEGAAGTKMDSTIWRAIQNGEPYFSKDANVNGVKYYAYYQPTMKDGKCVGAIFAGQPASEVDKSIVVAMLNMIMIGVISGCIFVTIAMKISRRMALKLSRLREVIGTLSANDLSVDYPRYDHLKDEIELISNEAVDFTVQIRNIIRNIAGASRSLNEVSDELETAAANAQHSSEDISCVVQNVAEGAESQSRDTQSITERMTTMADNMDIMRESMSGLSTTFEKVSDVAAGMVDTMNKADVQAAEIIVEVEEVNHQIEITSHSMDEIRKMVDVIKDIASQTNLLSLNASIEAARAGDAGRGFAVVAEQVKSLAEQSSGSALEIESTINGLVENYDLIIQKMNVTTASMAEQRESINGSKSAFSELDSDIQRAAGEMKTAAGVVEILEKMKNEVVDAICSLSAIGEQNSAATEEASASMEELSSIMAETADKAKEVEQQAKALMEDVRVFKV